MTESTNTIKINPWSVNTKAFVKGCRGTFLTFLRMAPQRTSLVVKGQAPGCTIASHTVGGAMCVHTAYTEVCMFVKYVKQDF